MHFTSTTFFLAAAVILQGATAQFCTGPPADCNFEDVSIKLGASLLPYNRNADYFTFSAESTTLIRGQPAKQRYEIAQLLTNYKT